MDLVNLGSRSQLWERVRHCKNDTVIVLLVFEQALALASTTSKRDWKYGVGSHTL